MTRTLSCLQSLAITAVIFAVHSTVTFADEKLQATKSEAICEEIYRETGYLVVPASFAGRQGLAMVSTTSNMVVVNSPENLPSLQYLRVVQPQKQASRKAT